MTPRHAGPMGDDAPLWLFGDQLGPHFHRSAATAHREVVLIESSRALGGRPAHRQKLHLVLSGLRHLARELGARGLAKSRRRVGDSSYNSRLTLTLDDGGTDRTLRMVIPVDGVARIDARPHQEQAEMRSLWKRLQRQVIVAYGASRNLSDREESRYNKVAQQVQRQMTLFDPMAQVAGVDVVIRKTENQPDILLTLVALLGSLFEEEGITVHTGSGDSPLVFTQRESEVDATELPDGYRSSVAWLADLCVAWHTGTAEERNNGGDLSKISGIVLVDEIGLHLHPSLERTLIPRLRKALPNVQFIVTTHSPMVLAAFDRDELVILDRDEPGGVRELDRQIFGMSMDDVYEWLMGTSPGSSVVEDMIEAGSDPDIAAFLYQSSDVDQEDARLLLEHRRELVRKLRQEKERGEIP